MVEITQKTLPETVRRGCRALSIFLCAGVLVQVGVTPAAHAFDPPKTEKAAEKKPPPPPAEDPEVKIGREAHAEMLKSGLKLVTDPKLVERVETIGKKVAAANNATETKAMYGSSTLVPYDYKFFIVDDKDINAFSLPGGYIYVNKGILDYAQSDDELAGVLGHEIIHSAHHHVMRLQKEASSMNNKVMLAALVALLAKVPTTDAMNLFRGFELIAVQKVNGYGQQAERDSDHNGLVVMQKAGYNPVGMLTFMERLARDQRMRPDVELGIFRTHPPEVERVAALTSQLKEQGIVLNRRAVTKMLLVEVRKVAVTPAIEASEVLLDQKVIYRTPSPERAKETAARLNAFLDKDLQIYDVTKRGTAIVVRGETLFTIGAGDTDLPGSPSADKLADTGYKNLRFALYRQSIESGY